MRSKFILPTSLVKHVYTSRDGSQFESDELRGNKVAVRTITLSLRGRDRQKFKQWARDTHVI